MVCVGHRAPNIYKTALSISSSVSPADVSKKAGAYARDALEAFLRLARRFVGDGGREPRRFFLTLQIT